MTGLFSVPALFVAWACVAQQPPATAPQTPVRYFLNASDVVEFKFSYNADMNERVTIRPDGYISLSMIGDVMARGETPEQLAKLVQERYTGILRRPEVVAIVREFSSQRIFIAGEVNAPGMLPLLGKLTLAQALFNAGGPKPTARLNQLVLLRYEGSNRSSAQLIRMNEILRGGQQDIALEPYDVIFVPRSKIAQVGLFVEQYINNLVPRSLLFPYNVNNVLSVHP